MTGREKIKRAFRTRVQQPAGAGDGYRIFYSPRSLQQVKGVNGTFPAVPPPFQANVHIAGDDVRVQWVNAPIDPEATASDFEEDATGRAFLLHEWLARLSCLLRLVDTWAKELGWSTRWIEKSMQDAQIGEYHAPALLMQEGPDRVLLEPIARTASGCEGVVDLYLMPAYDDIASLFFYDRRWNIHYNTRRSTNAVVPVPQAEAMPLSKETLQQVLAEMRQHAA